MKKVILIFYSLCVILSLNACVKVDDAKQPVANTEIVQTNTNTFKISDLSNYSGTSVKTLTQRDSMYGKHSNHRIMCPKTFVNLFGNKNTTLKTTYVYIGDNSLETDGVVEWRYYNPPSWNGRGKGEFRYDANEVMEKGKPGDLLVVAKKNKDEIFLILIQKNNPAINQVYDIIGMNKVSEKPKPEQISTSSDATITDEPKSKPAPKPIKADGWIQVYFTPSTDCENNIIEQINNAKKIDVAVYSITNRKIVDALISAKKGGKKIRIITDRLQSKGKGSLVPELQSNGFEVKTNIKHKIMHHKFAVFDGKDIETGSYNWTDSATKSNAENCLFFKQTKKEFTKQYDYLWNFYGKQ